MHKTSDMGNSLLLGLPQDQIARLQRTQNSAARLVTLEKKSAHITPILQELHWLPVGYRIVYKLMLIVFKSLHDLAPEYIDSLLMPYNPPRSLRSSNMSLLCEPRSKRSWGIGLFQSLHHVYGIHYHHMLNLALLFHISKVLLRHTWFLRHSHNVSAPHICFVLL